MNLKVLIPVIVLVIILVIAVVLIVVFVVIKKKGTKKKRDTYKAEERYDNLTLATAFLDSLSVNKNSSAPTVTSILTEYTKPQNLTHEEKPIYNENISEEIKNKTL